MTNIEITDEMIDRMIDELWNGIAPQTKPHEVPIVRHELRKAARRVLNIALSPSPEPGIEIEVSEGMKSAGRAAYVNCVIGDPVCETIYRAMEAQRRKEQGKEWPKHGRTHYRGNDYPIFDYAHRRATDK